MASHENTKGRGNKICLRQSSHLSCRYLHDRDINLALHQKVDEQTKQEGYITVPDTTLSTKITEQYFNGIYDLQILNDNRILL